eukprot:2355974-Rhodomonas_salina.1
MRDEKTKRQGTSTVTTSSARARKWDSDDSFEGDSPAPNQQSQARRPQRTTTGAEHSFKEASVPGFQTTAKINPIYRQSHAQLQEPQDSSSDSEEEANMQARVLIEKTRRPVHVASVSVDDSMETEPLGASLLRMVAELEEDEVRAAHLCCVEKNMSMKLPSDLVHVQAAAGRCSRCDPPRTEHCI